MFSGLLVVSLLQSFAVVISEPVCVFISCLLACVSKEQTLKNVDLN